MTRHYLCILQFLSGYAFLLRLGWPGATHVFALRMVISCRLLTCLRLMVMVMVMVIGLTIMALYLDGNGALHVSSLVTGLHIAYD